MKFEKPRVSLGIGLWVPYGRAVRKTVELVRLATRRCGARVYELELVRGVVVDERSGESCDVVDARAVVDDPESRGEGWEEGKAGWVAYAESQELA